MRLPAGTVTLLLADVEGSVRLWEDDPAAMRTAMKTLERIADEAIREHGGVRPVEQGEGDNLVAGFERASDAVACAVAIQLGIEGETWPGEIPPRLRAAIHTGEAELRDEGRYDGEAINRCARLRDGGHGGQVLLSRTTHDLVVDRLPEGVALTKLGTHRLRDMARPEEVYQVCHPELPSAFPALRAPGGPPNNLPRQLTSFIGREAEISAVAEILTEARLVTLTGAGGCGKTRLGIQVAMHVLDGHPDGAWWVDLARLSDPGLVPAALASALAVKEEPGRSVAETVQGHLAGRSALVVLDNCEHVIDACAELADGLLRTCPSVRILATSREPLGVLGEVAWRVPSLVVPDEGELGIESLSQCEAVRLFIDRALRVRPNFQVTNDNAPAVAEICFRLDGIPLAIELAASRTRMMTPEQIVAGLDDRFRLLTGSQRGVLPRHRTLEASVGWSYDLLGSTERTMLARLSVFRGSFTLDAAEGVCSGPGIERMDVLGVLSDLVDRSLVQVEEDGSQARYRFLETIRQYAADRLAESGEEAATHTRHLDHYVALAEEAETELEGPGIKGELERLDREHGNLRAAMDHGQRSGQATKVLRIAGAIWKYWLVRGHVTEAHRRVEAATQAEDIDPLVRARALVGVCAVAELEYSPPWALGFADEAVALAREAGDERILGRALAILGVSFGFRASPSAPAVIDEAIEVCRRTGDASFLGAALHARFQQLTAMGEVREARETAEEAVAVARAAGDTNMLVMHLGPLGWALAMQGALDAAEAVYVEGLQTARDLGNRPWAEWCLAGLAVITGMRGDLDRATETIEEIVSRSRSSGSLFPTFVMYAAELAYRRGDVRAAEEHADELSALARAIEWGLMSTRALELKSNLSLLRGDVTGAEAFMEDAAAVELEDSGAAAWWAIMPGRARVARARGDHAAAEDLWHQVLRSQVDGGTPLEVPDVLEALAGLAALAESDEEAARLFGAAEAAREHMGVVRPPVDQGAYEADVALVRERLSEEDFERAWDEGRAMTLEEAVAYAARGRGERKRPSSGWASLTPTEVEVVKLVAEGLTNPQIAERLFVARATVKAHLSNIFRKLDVSTRSGLAAEATRQGLED